MCLASALAPVSAGITLPTTLSLLKQQETNTPPKIFWCLALYRVLTHAAQLRSIRETITCLLLEKNPSRGQAAEAPVRGGRSGAARAPRLWAAARVPAEPERGAARPTCGLTMVLLAAAVCTNARKAIVSRQFVEMTRTRIEGLLAAFPKLMNTGKQHTFVETESVRYVYQPMEKLYMVLITTKNSNILEALETLRLFSRVIPEYCRASEENEISEHCFDLIFAFDEIVALGCRENVNLAQIRTFTEMDSHEEKVF